MKHTKQIIEDAIEGGWEPEFEQIIKQCEHTGKITQYIEGEVFLDPLFWQAVGKTRGWYEKAWKDEFGGDPWRDYWHKFIEYLAEGDDYETALSKLNRPN